MFLYKTAFAENWFLESCEIDVEMMKMVFCHLHGKFGMSFIVFACACSTTNSKPFSTWFYFNNFVAENFVEMVLRFSLHAACEQLETAFLSDA